MVVTIDSSSNAKIKHICKIASSSKYRKESSEFFLEGLRLCCDACKSFVEAESVFFTEKAYEKNSSHIEEMISVCKNAYKISESVCDKIAQTENSQGVFCICKTPESDGKQKIDTTKKYIALDNVQNPDNLGAISRTAEALGISGLIVSGGCDIYNPKAQRAAMGSLLRLPVFKTDDLVSYLRKLQKSAMKIYATTPDASSLKITEADFSSGTICVIGNEANGVSSNVFDVCEKITIPMLGRAESLNAAMAAAVTMWEMMRS